jgi:hypothetical protein
MARTLFSAIRALCWLAGWIVVTIVYSYCVGSHSPTLSRGEAIFLALLGIPIAGAGLAGISYGCSARLWIASSVGSAVVILSLVAITASQNVPTSETRRSRVCCYLAGGLDRLSEVVKARYNDRNGVKGSTYGNSTDPGVLGVGIALALTVCSRSPTSSTSLRCAPA